MPLGADKNLTRRLWGQEESYWVSVNHHHPPPNTHLSSPLSTKDYRTGTQLLRIWVCFPICKNKKSGQGEVYLFRSSLVQFTSLPLKVFEKVAWAGSSEPLSHQHLGKKVLLGRQACKGERGSRHKTLESIEKVRKDGW